MSAGRAVIRHTGTLSSIPAACELSVVVYSKSQHSGDGEGAQEWSSLCSKFKASIGHMKSISEQNEKQQTPCSTLPLPSCCHESHLHMVYALWRTSLGFLLHLESSRKEKLQTPDTITPALIFVCPAAIIHVIPLHGFEIFSTFLSIHPGRYSLASLVSQIY